MSFVCRVRLWAFRVLQRVSNVTKFSLTVDCELVTRRFQSVSVDHCYEVFDSI